MQVLFVGPVAWRLRAAVPPGQNVLLIGVLYALRVLHAGAPFQPMMWRLVAVMLPLSISTTTHSVLQDQGILAEQQQQQLRPHNTVVGVQVQ
jgi:hypothetical protein